MKVPDNIILPPIPDKLHFSIGEVAKLCGVKAHVLRYWEQVFPQLDPRKWSGKRRIYNRSEILLIRRIRSLLYDQGFTISGAKAKLSESKEDGLNNLKHAVEDAISALETVALGLEACL